MKVTLVSHTENAERLLVFTKGVRFGATVNRWAEVHQMAESDIQAELAYMADTIPSSWEFVDYVFCIEGVSRAFTHQFVRNRHGSYAQESMRVVGKEGALIDQFVMPSRFKHESEIAVRTVLGDIQHAVRELQNRGEATEDIRSILPTNIKTNIVAKFNLRTLAELAKSRLGGRTQDEYQSVMTQMVDRVLAVHPWAIDFLLPHGRDYFAEIEAFAEREYGGDLIKKGVLLKIVDKMRKEAK
jgi:flavin-dependent thymidylate synthase